MKAIVLLFFTFFFMTCATKTQQNNDECNDTISILNTNKEFENELIFSLIRNDEKKRNIWSYDIKESASSPLFYESICDEGLYLYRVAIENQQTYVVMVEDENIGTLEDYIGIKSNGLYGKDGVEYEHKGHYEIIDDSTVDVVFEKRWSNYCYTCDSCEKEFIYYIKCTHTYEFHNMAFERTKADTIVMIDERSFFCCEDTLMSLFGLL